MQEYLQTGSYGLGLGLGLGLGAIINQLPTSI